MSNRPPIYLLPGMTVEYPVFLALASLLPDAKVVNYLEPRPGETLVEYAERMAPGFPKDCCLMGVSFGGIVAQEIAKIVNPAACILISTIRGPHELPPHLRIWSYLGGRNCLRVLNFVGSSAKRIPKSLQTSSIKRLEKLAGPAGAWHRWATCAVLDWRPDPRPVPSPILKIHGDADTTFPLRYTRSDVVIHNGTHALPMSHPTEVSQAVIKFLNTLP